MKIDEYTYRTGITFPLFPSISRGFNASTSMVMFVVLQRIRSWNFRRHAFLKGFPFGVFVDQALWREAWWSRANVYNSAIHCITGFWLQITSFKDLSRSVVLGSIEKRLGNNSTARLPVFHP